MLKVEEVVLQMKQRHKKKLNSENWANLNHKFHDGDVRGKADLSGVFP